MGLVTTFCPPMTTCAGEVVQTVNLGSSFRRTKIDKVCERRNIGAVMAARPTNISLTPELKAFIDSRVRSGLYGNSSDVIRAGLRALVREELGPSLKRF